MHIAVRIVSVIHNLIPQMILKNKTIRTLSFTVILLHPVSGMLECQECTQPHTGPLGPLHT